MELVELKQAHFGPGYMTHLNHSRHCHPAEHRTQASYPQPNRLD